MIYELLTMVAIAGGLTLAFAFILVGLAVWRGELPPKHRVGGIEQPRRKP